jgi:hypothetical protein
LTNFLEFDQDRDHCRILVNIGLFKVRRITSVYTKKRHERNKDRLMIFDISSRELNRVKTFQFMSSLDFSTEVM